MPVDFTLPPDTRAVGTGNPPQDVDNIVDALIAAGAGANILNAAYSGGADPTGTNDSTAAIQAAINAATFTAANDASGILGAAKTTIYIPGGTYLISTGPLVLPRTRSLRITGAGDGATLKSTANAIIDFDGLNGLTEGSVEIDHLGFDAAGGHVFQNPNMHGQLSLHDLAIRQRSTGFSVFWMDDIATGVSTGLYQAIFRNIRYTLDPGTRSVEAWHLVSGHSDGVTDLTWEHISGPVPTGYTGSDATMDNTQYQWYVTCSSATGAHMSNLTWRNCIMSSPFGGIIKAAAQQNLLIENISAYNTFDRAMTASLYWLTKDATNNAPVQNSVIRNCFRTNALGSGATQPPYDVLLDATCKSILIENYAVGYSPAVAFINVGGASGVVVVAPGGSGAGSVPAITNQAADTVVIGQGAVTVGGAALQPPAAWTPGDSGYLAWTGDPVLLGLDGAIAPTNNTITLLRVNIRQAVSVTSVLLWLDTLGTSLTSAQNFAGLYAGQTAGAYTAGQLIGTSADQTTAWNTGGSTGLKTIALSGGPFSIPAGTFVWVAILTNQSAGTNPKFATNGKNYSGGATNAGVAAAASRSAINTTGTTLPGSITPSSNTAKSWPIWAALS